MSPRTHSGVNARDRAFLYVSEILHRIRNEYSQAISFASILAKKSTNQETKDAPGEIITHLRAVAETHRVLRPPMIDGSVDLIDVISQLCDAVSASDFRRREIELSLGVCDPIFLEANRCWLVSLIVAELINNSFRHAFATRSGRIEVSLIVSDNLVLCNVSDNGLAAAPVAAGVGCASRGTGRRGRTAFPRRRGISYSLISDRSVNGYSFRREPRCKFATL